MRRWLALVVAAGVALPLTSGCSESGSVVSTAPACSSVERLGLLAESVPTSSYIPCVVALPPGWTSSGLDVRNGSTRFELLSDRAQGHAVRVEFGRRCDESAGAPIPPRTIGGRTFLAVRAVDPRYTGTMYDVFPGGCVSLRFDFARGPHIALMADLQSAVGYLARTELRRELRRRLGVELP
jgi:hypothetical protein